MKSTNIIKRKEVLIFILLLITHLFHIIEEVLGNAYFIESLYKGLTNFLVINMILWIIPIILFFYIIKKKKIAYYFSIIYGLMMIFDGLDHIVRNYSGFYTGILLIIFGYYLIYYLKKELKNMKGGKNGKTKLRKS